MQNPQPHKKFSELGIKVEHKKYVGEKIRLAKVLNTEITIYSYEIKPSKYPKKENDLCLYLQISVGDKKYVAFSIAKLLMDTIQKIPKEAFPFTTIIRNDNDIYEFT